MPRPRRHSRVHAGFTLVELMVAMAMFLAMAGAAFTLFAEHAQLASRQENLSAVNIGLRNAMAQLEIDLSSAGQNLLSSVPGNSGTAFSLGAIIQNSVTGVAAACTVNTSSWAYPTSSVCFDSLEIVNPKLCSSCATPYSSYPYVPVLQISDTADNLNTTTTIQATDSNSADTLSLATVAANFQNGDELVIVTPANGHGNPPHCPSNGVTTSQSPFCMTTVTLTANATVLAAASCPITTASCIRLTHSLVGSAGQPAACPGTNCTDPLGIVYNTFAPNSANYYSALSPGTYGTNSYVIDMGSGTNDVWYSVLQNPSNAADTQLMRCVGGPCNGANEQQLTDQVIGFKAGAALWNQAATTEIGSFFYNANDYCSGFIETSTSPVAYANCSATPPPFNDPYDFSLVRSVRISMIARTTPNVDARLSQFQNGFDNGPYLVQQASVVVDLRNMSMGQFGN